MDAGFGNSLAGDGAALIAVLAAFGLFFLARRLLRHWGVTSTGQRIADLEARLNEAETAIAAEAHVLVIWRGKQTLPDRVMGSMHGAAMLPEAPGVLIDFASWLDRDSASALSDCLHDLRQDGTPFNIAIKSIADELLEADGRTAGGLATLRFRPLAGERRKIADLAHEAHRLGKQVERLSAVLDAAPLPVWLRGAEGKLLWVNRCYAAAVDAADPDLVVSQGTELVGRAAMDRTATGAAAGCLGRIHAVVSGSMRALDVFEAPVTGGTVGFAIDMTALEKAEKELDRHIKSHTSTLNKLDTAIAIFGPDQRLRFHNAAYAALWPLIPEWLASNPSDAEILDRLRNQRCIPEQANYQEWRAKQLNAYTTIDPWEDRWHLPDGRTLHVVCEQHPFGGLTYLYENVTNELALESRYNELIGVQRETLDNLEEGIALLGSDGRLKLYNPAFARFWQLDPEALDAQPHIEELARHGSQIAADSSTWDEVRYSVTRLDSERKPVAGNIDVGGRVLQFVAVPLPDGNTLLTFADISDSARMERALRDRADALEAADRLKNMFLSNVSYEIRTPLTSILGFAESLQIGLAGPLNAKQQDYVRDIRRSSTDLKTIIDAIIDLTAIDAGALELKLEHVEVTGLLEAVAEKLANQIDERDLTLNIEVGADVNSFVADPKRVEQILSNLLSNAIGFSDRGATIRMGAKKTRGQLQLWVSDQGRGIEPEFQKQAFDRFQSRPVPGGHRGPGLGLAIVKSLVELHEGQVSLLSKINQGTTVLCTFPLDGPGAAQRADLRKSA
ncbi:PAS domain-containing sensor histidine kinase [Aestuariivirga sp.]|uniref:PAS domain-containing sensor histidine kinase n=1 Tax=Aestuariivirga sp. TaxID=2650926 RepID=UPI0025BC2DCB|nr:PAS domain-containing sensor histidine kinase [Aestuariivirga sp.]MCA3555954.1 PAS-domain containing protein [Aestuariivirga sp.]